MRFVYHFDVIIADSVGVPFYGDSYKFSGMGGSEFEQILLAEELVKNGKTVACLNKSPSWSRARGVEYFPLDILSYEKFECESLILERGTKRPSRDEISSKKLFRWVTDSYWGQQDDDAWIVCVSRWQAELKSGHDEKIMIIRNMIPDWVYDIKPNRNTKANSFIYASAAMKGLQETINYFSTMKKSKEFRDATLTVMNPGYDSPKDVVADGVTFKGSLPFSEVVKEMQKCRSMIHVSTFKETFGIAHVLAELLGLNVFVFQTQGEDALNEVMNGCKTDRPDIFNSLMAKYGKEPQSFLPKSPKFDYRASTIIKQWMEII